MSGSPGSIEASRSKTTSKRRQSSSDLSEAFDDTIHLHSDKIEKLAAMDFGPKGKLEEGSVVKLGGRLFVIAVSTSKFVCDGNEIPASPPRPRSMLSWRASAGDAISFNRRQLVIEDRLTAARPKVESGAPA
jgi:hypothetical protein